MAGRGFRGLKISANEPNRQSKSGSERRYKHREKYSDCADFACFWNLIVPFMVVLCVGPRGAGGGGGQERTKGMTICRQERRKDRKVAAS